MPRFILLHKTSLQGFRESNEDVERFKLNLCRDPNNTESDKSAPVDFFVVCDGHGGDYVSKYVAPKLESLLTARRLMYPLSRNYINKVYNNIQNSLINHPQKIAEACGSTAIVAIRYMHKNKEKMQIINLGDCRAVLSRKGLAIPLNKDHKPFWPDEKIRIDRVNYDYNTNKKIYYDGDWRIGDLSVSRSFGDIDNTPHVTHVPESFNHELLPDDEFIIIACDGLWDVLQNHEAVNFVRDHYNNNRIEYYNLPGKYPTDDILKSNNIARKLATYAIARGSTDNVSIFIIFLVE